MNKRDQKPVLVEARVDRDLVHAMRHSTVIPVPRLSFIYDLQVYMIGFDQPKNGFNSMPGNVFFQNILHPIKGYCLKPVKVFRYNIFGR